MFLNGIPLPGPKYLFSVEGNAPAPSSLNGFEEPKFPSILDGFTTSGCDGSFPSAVISFPNADSSLAPADVSAPSFETPAYIAVTANADGNSTANSWVLTILFSPQESKTYSAESGLPFGLSTSNSCFGDNIVALVSTTLILPFR